MSLMLVGLAGCASVPTPAEFGCRFDGAEDITPAETRAARVQALGERLRALGPQVDPDEADRVAAMALGKSIAQRREYEITTSAQVHNLMVVNGSRKRGLCVHWTRDLLDTLRAADLQTFTLYWGIANEGNVLTEHSTVVIAARGDPFEKGIVLDGWRHSGCLYWGPSTDDKYAWKQAARYDRSASR
jgi:hypothetical protein